MFDFFHFANLARKGYIKFGEGRITITSMRTLFFDVDSLNSLTNELENIFGYNGSAHFLYRMSIHGGSRAAKAHHKFSKYEKDELIYYMAKMATGAGWGKLKVTELNTFVKVSAHDSPFIKRKSKHPTCHFLRGYIAGTITYAKRTRYDCIETKCKSTGSKHCEFVIGMVKDLKRKNEYKPFLNQISAFEFDY